jgi:uncharacterized protein
MKAPVPFTCRNKKLWLTAERCIYWEDEQTLILSDLHFGKTGHFRKSGIPVPQSVYKKDLQRLFEQLQHFQPKQLVIVGDMFHSRDNKELDLFKKWRSDFPDLHIHLIKGNHDILHDSWYKDAAVTVTEPSLFLNDFVFHHDPYSPNEKIQSDNYIFSGHLHPGIRINGNGRQSLSFPCFYFSSNFAVLPAFSAFTGLALISPQHGENVFAIVKNEVIQLQ